jgi:FkbH-like protein
MGGPVVVASRIVVAANFTAQAIADTLDFWLREIGLPAELTFAPYDQVFQSLLDDGGALASNRDGYNVVLIDRARWLTGAGDELLGAIDDLIRAVRTCADRSGVPHLVVSCPAGTGPPELLAAAERRLADGLAADPRVRVIGEAQLLAWYPVETRFDPYTDRAADLPYTREMLAALATAVIRAVAAWRVPRPKVIAVDADHTLWDGVVAEDGPLGVRVTPAHRQLQEYLLAQRADGRLICVVSRNLEADVRQALATHPDMALREEHVSGWRVNWRPKSENLAALAAELNVGLDSMVFLDDNPVERAEVDAAYPQVLTPILPAHAADVVAYLRRCWPLDRLPVTEDDRARADRYRQDAERTRARTAAGSLADFFATLDLRVDVRPLAAADLARAAQLSQRVNQFNLTTRRYHEAELAALPDGRALVVHARDRFGDYGLVGLAVTAAVGDTLAVDNLLLSCRVLGRGVEHAVLRHLGRLAHEQGLAWVLLRFAPTARNQPAQDFLDSLAAETEPAVSYRLATRVAEAVAHEPGHPDERRSTPDPTGSRVDGPVAAMPVELAHRIATDLATAAQIVAAVDRRPATLAPSLLDTDDPVETAVAAMWTELLDYPPVSVHDDFYQLGGDSLMALQFAARVRDEYGLELPVEVLFTDTFTVATMARAIRDLRSAEPDDEALAGMLAELEQLSDDEVRSLLEDGRA